jgi:hypothetical protein
MGYTAGPRRARTRCGMANPGDAWRSMDGSWRSRGDSADPREIKEYPREMRKFGEDPEEIQREDRSTGEKIQGDLGKYRKIRLKDTRRSVQDIGRSMEDIETSGIRYLQGIWGDLRKYREIQEVMGDYGRNSIEDFFFVSKNSIALSPCLLDFQEILHRLLPLLAL